MCDPQDSLRPSPKDSSHARELTEREIADLRALTLEERGRMIDAACRSAASILESRRRAGLPDARPIPWPESTLEFLRRHSHHAGG
jgi:hypothetical protein